MNKPQQLTFPWSKQNKFTFDDFFFDSSNEEVKLALKNNEDVFLYGAEDSGKSFLLQSTCNYYTSDYKSSVYIPISEAIKHGTSFIDSLEGLDLICLDDIDLIASNKDWEVGIFNLINDCLSSNCRLIFSSCKNPSSINFELDDLRSRIKRIDQLSSIQLVMRTCQKQ